MIFGRLQGFFNETKRLNLLLFNFGDMPPDPPKRAYSARKIFWPLSKSSREPCRRKPALKEEYLVKKCLLLVKYKQLQKKRTERSTHCILATDSSVGNKNFQSIIKLGFHQILRNNMETKGKLSLLYRLFYEPMRSMTL